MFMIGKVRPEVQKLVKVAKECLELGLKAARPWGFLGDDRSCRSGACREKWLFGSAGIRRAWSGPSVS